MHVVQRETALRYALAAAVASLSTAPLGASADGGILLGGEKADIPALAGKDYGKSAMSYEDFRKTPSGLLYKDATVGSGKSPGVGDRAVVEWSGYTIGYFGRPFETKRLRELDNIDEPFFRFVIGAQTAVPALEEGVQSMTEGGVRQLVVPPALGYPASDPDHRKVGPRPSTFSGQRALDFVLFNKDLIDKTLLFNVKLIRVDKGR